MFPDLQEMYDTSVLKELREAKREVIIFGLSLEADWCFHYLRKQGVQIRYFCTEDPAQWGAKFLARRILSPYDLRESAGNCVLMVAGKEHAPVARMLDYLHIELPILSHPHYAPHTIEGALKNPDRVRQAYDYLEDDYSRFLFVELLRCRVSLQGQRYRSLCTAPKYFPPDIFQLSDKEIFVDGGAHNGETIVHFLDWANGEFAGVHAFEPDPRCMAPIRRRHITRAQFARIRINNCGLSDADGELRLKLAESVGSGTSELSESAGQGVPVRSLDSYLSGEPVTIFKLDVEKHERQAIRGAQGTLQAHKPKLAICVYHLHDDQWEIPLLVKEMVPEYKLYMRHHSWAENETVLYALPK